MRILHLCHVAVGECDGREGQHILKHHHREHVVAPPVLRDDFVVYHAAKVRVVYFLYLQL